MDHFDTARGAEKSSTKEDTNQFLTFTVDGEEYGLGIMTVREIKGWTHSTRLPGTPDYMRGVMNLRGLIVPIFDLRARFGRGLTEATEKHVVIILAMNERTIGLLVDAVSDILEAGESQIKPPPGEGGQLAGGDFISGLISLESRMVVLLSAAQLFSTETIDACRSQAA